MTDALADTSVVIDWDDPVVASALPQETAVSTITLAEMATGPHLAPDAGERARRQNQLQTIESAFEALPFDAAAARSYGQIVAAVNVAGRSHRGRILDLMIAAIAHANSLDLYTRNPQDFSGLDELLNVVGV